MANADDTEQKNNGHSLSLPYSYYRYSDSSSNFRVFPSGLPRKSWPTITQRPSYPCCCRRTLSCALAYRTGNKLSIFYTTSRRICDVRLASCWNCRCCSCPPIFGRPHYTNTRLVGTKSLCTALPPSKPCLKKSKRCPRVLPGGL